MYAVLNPYGYRVGALYGQGTDWETCRPARFMSKKFTAAQQSYRTFEHEALGVIEALMKWEDKLVGRQFIIVTDHEALETIKTSNRNEDRVFEAEQMAEASRIANIPDPVIDDGGGDLTVADALQNGPSLRKVIFGDKTFTKAVKDGYKSDTTFTKVIDNPGHYPIFRVIDGD